MVMNSNIFYVFSLVVPVKVPLKHSVAAGWWYQDDLAPLMDFIEALRSEKLFQHCIIVKTLSCEVTPKHMHTDIQTNLRMIRYYPCIVHTGSTQKRLSN